jgi:hypothetical protein
MLKLNQHFADSALWLAIWSAVEPGLGIITSSLSTIRPLLRALLPHHISGDEKHILSPSDPSGKHATGATETTKSQMSQLASDTVVEPESRLSKTLPLSPSGTAHIQQYSKEKGSPRNDSSLPIHSSLQSRLVPNAQWQAQQRQQLLQEEVRRSRATAGPSMQDDSISDSPSLPIFLPTPIESDRHTATPGPAATFPLSTPAENLPRPDDRRGTNWNYGDRMSWADRLDQVEALQQQKQQMRQMKKRLKDPAQREGLPLGIFGLAPPANGRERRASWRSSLSSLMSRVSERSRSEHAEKGERGG